MESPVDRGSRKHFAPNTQDVHIWDHSLLVLSEYKSTASLKHTEPLHILIGQSITTKPGMTVQPRQTTDARESHEDHALRAFSVVILRA